MSAYDQFSKLAERAPSVRQRDVVEYRRRLDAAASAALKEATTDARRSEVWGAWMHVDSVIDVPRRGPMRSSDLPPRVDSAQAEAFMQKLDDEIQQKLTQEKRNDPNQS